jgi:hypothetical protein
VMPLQEVYVVAAAAAQQDAFVCVLSHISHIVQVTLRKLSNHRCGSARRKTRVVAAAAQEHGMHRRRAPARVRRPRRGHQDRFRRRERRTRAPDPSGPGVRQSRVSTRSRCSALTSANRSGNRRAGPAQRRCTPPNSPSNPTTIR